MLDRLNNPGAAYRPVPFWSWNDRLDEAMLRDQIRAMRDAGIGGFFMHARGGLLTPYLGDEWFSLVAACVDEAERCGMRAWAYDENGWPSGFGDGRVNGLGVAYQQKYLRRRVLASGDAFDADCFLCLHAEGRVIADADAAADFARRAPSVLFYYDVNPFYVDTLDAEVARVFLDQVYDAYARRLPPALWERLAGFFTDEPQISRNGIPWSFTLPGEYREAYDDDLPARLDELFVEGGDFRRTRHRFWKLVTRLFARHFMKPIHDWCGARGKMITGHHVLEETYRAQLTTNGAIMPQYEYYHIPGIDWLGRRIRPATAPLQLLSAGAQLGKRRLLSETFACCGWDVRFSDLKWIAQYQMVHGVNWLCQHLEGYSLRGIRKRDYPASHFRHQPWWDRYRAVNDYFSRLGVLLHDGDAAADVLLLHGQTSAWGHFDDDAAENVDRLWDVFNSLTERLDAAHVAFHYGDDTLIERHGSADGAVLVVGERRYGVVVMPPLDDLGGRTADLLTAFTAAGGRVLALRHAAAPGLPRVDGLLSETFDRVARGFAWFDDEAALIDAVAARADVVPVVAPGTPTDRACSPARQLDAIIVARRRLADLEGRPAEAYYFASVEPSRGVDAEIHLPAGHIRRFDPATGELVPVHFRVEDGRAVVPHYFAGAGDLVLIAADGAPVPAAAVEHDRIAPETLEKGRRRVPLGGDFALQDVTPNLLTLDYADCYFDGELQFADGYILDVQDMACALRRPVEVRLDFRFGVAPGFRPAGGLDLIMEIPERFAATLNGRPLALIDAGYLFDPAFRRIAVGDAIRDGDNILSLTTRFEQPREVYELLDTVTRFEAQRNKLSYAMEIEAVYLAGAFAVRPKGPWEELEREALRFPRQRFVLEAPPAEVDLADMTPCGFPFFSGRATLATTFRLDAAGAAGPAFLAWDRHYAVVAGVRVNGHAYAPTLWPPCVVALDNLREGDNRLELELTGSLRNMLGPHHLAEGESYGVGPPAFYRRAGAFAAWQPAPDGTYAHWNDAYCVKRFGIEGLRLLLSGVS